MSRLDEVIVRAQRARVRPEHARRRVATLGWWVRPRPAPRRARRWPYLAGACALAIAAAAVVIASRPGGSPSTADELAATGDARARPSHVAEPVPAPTDLADPGRAPADRGGAPPERRHEVAARPSRAIETDIAARPETAARTDGAAPDLGAPAGGPDPAAGLADRWRDARKLRAEGHFDAAIAACVALAEARDPTWSPIALVEAARIALGPIAAPERAVALADRFAAEWPAHALAAEVRDLRCRALSRLGRSCVELRAP